MEKINAKILKINQLTENVSEFILELKKEIPFKAGQFVMIDIENWDEKIKKNAYSVSSYDKKSWKLILLIKYTWGIWTSWLWTKKSWENLSIYWAIWHFWIKLKKENFIFFATWIWLPPFICMLENLFLQLNWENKKVQLFFWVREKKDIYYLDFLENLSKKYPNFSYEICLSREKWFWFNWYITEHPEFKNINFEESEVYYCGSVPVSKSLKEKLFSLGLEKKLFFSEAF